MGVSHRYFPELIQRSPKCDTLATGFLVTGMVQTTCIQTFWPHQYLCEGCQTGFKTTQCVLYIGFQWLAWCRQHAVCGSDHAHTFYNTAKVSVDTLSTQVKFSKHVFDTLMRCTLPSWLMKQIVRRCLSKSGSGSFHRQHILFNLSWISTLLHYTALVQRSSSMDGGHGLFLAACNVSSLSFHIWIKDCCRCLCCWWSETVHVWSADIRNKASCRFWWEPTMLWQSSAVCEHRLLACYIHDIKGSRTLEVSVSPALVDLPLDIIVTEYHFLKKCVQSSWISGDVCPEHIFFLSKWLMD